MTSPSLGKASVCEAQASTWPISTVRGRWSQRTIDTNPMRGSGSSDLPAQGSGDPASHCAREGSPNTAAHRAGPQKFPTPLSMHAHWTGQLLTMLTCRKGMMPSRAMACSRRGAPVRLCRPAPQVEKKEPMMMTQGDGQANIPMTSLP